jgi:hypothetical protein
MWTLWLFGTTVEDRLGHGRYLAFYLACGLAASIAHVAFNPTSVVPALGASGAIAGVLGCYMRILRCGKQSKGMGLWRDSSGSKQGTSAGRTGSVPGRRKIDRSQ